MTARTDRVKAVRDARTAAVLTCDKDGGDQALVATGRLADFRCAYGVVREQERDRVVLDPGRSEEHTSELQSLMRISYAVFCLKKKKNNENILNIHETVSTSEHSTNGTLL